MVCYSRKYTEIEFTLKHKRYCDKHGINCHEADLDEINKAMREDNRKYWREYNKKRAERAKTAMQEPSALNRK